ncbi:hypothetical protein FA95DRAFT_1506230, partial [Auriscalpium vulgare]
LDESLLPFMHNTPAVVLTPSQLRTLELKSNYLRDLTSARQLILSRPDCPAVPVSIWKDVLSSVYVDLDKLFSSHYALDGDPRGLHKLGDFELVLGSSKPDRHIRTHGDWMVAWTPYSDAVTYAYPHRATELATYKDHICKLFAASQHAPWRVISYDKGIRSRVGRTNHYSLGDLHYFNDLFVEHFIPGGQGGGTGKSSSKTQGPGARVELCRKFNAGTCSNNPCRWRHRCSACGGEHAAVSCPSDITKATGGESGRAQRK